MTVAEFNNLDTENRKELLLSCCSSEVWVKSMLSVCPVNDLVDLLEYAEEKWYECNAAEWLEVFHEHAKVNELINSPQPFISAESGLLDLSEEQFEILRNSSMEYEENFGYNFIIFVKGKTTDEIISSLEIRLRNDPHDELLITAAEQNRITQSLLQKLFV